MSDPSPARFIGYGRQWIDDADIESVVAVLRSDYLTQGPRTAEFEQALCRLTGARYCVAVANGTAGLHLAVAALEPEPGDEGITSTNTFVASANCLAYNGLKPVLADIDSRTYNISIADAAARVTPRTRIFVPVHFAGRPVDMEALAAVARKCGAAVIEDAAHAIGSRHADGSPVGSCKHSDMTVFSFHPVKTITTGEGGAVTTNDPALYQKLMDLRTHGITRAAERLRETPGPWYYEMQTLGYNYRLTEIQSALGISQLAKLESFARRRAEIVSAYNRAFAGVEWLTTPVEARSTVFHLYVLLVDFARLGLTRKDVMGRLATQGIGTQVHYIPVHTQPFYASAYGYRPGDLPVSEAYYARALSIPLFPAMTEDDVQRVIESIKGLRR